MVKMEISTENVFEKYAMVKKWRQKQNHCRFPGYFQCIIGLSWPENCTSRMISELIFIFLESIESAEWDYLMPIGNPSSAKTLN